MSTRCAITMSSNLPLLQINRLSLGAAWASMVGIRSSAGTRGGQFMQSLTRRIAAGTLLIAVLSIASTGLFVYFIAHRTITKMATDDLTHLVDATANMVNQAAQQAVINHLRALAEANLASVSYLYEESKSGHMSEAEAKKLATGILLSQHIGESGYIYCIDSEGILRVHPKGDLIGTSIAGFEFAREQMQRKDGYLEYEWKNPGELEARPKALYMIWFKPWDWIISISSYRSEFDDLVNPKDFRNDILTISIGQSGYLFIIDSGGNAVIHPTLEGRNMLELKESGLDTVTREMLDKKDGSIVYQFRGPGDIAPRDKLAVFRYLPSFKWIIVGSAYIEEIEAPLKHTERVFVAVFLCTCAAALLLSWLFGRSVDAAQRRGNLALREALEATERIVDTVPFAFVIVDKAGRIRRANGAAGSILDMEPAELVGLEWGKFFLHDPKEIDKIGAAAGADKTPSEWVATDAEGKSIVILQSLIPVTLAGEELSLHAFIDLTERRQLETQLRHAQKLESVGQLAAGIAHEINTPAQYVGDNLHFLSQSFADLRTLLERYREAVAAIPATPEGKETLEALRTAEDEIDVTFVDENATSAFDQAIDGISRISTIVRSMKEFAHPERGNKSFAYINHALKTTLAVAKNEYKYVADIETEFGDLPPVPCYIGDLNQVFLNLIVNAAHSIADVVGKDGGRGIIRIKTSYANNAIRIEISDTGAGIPIEIRDRIFDPFFTTKEVGRGTGQGLAIARTIVVEKHGGTIDFTSEPGHGTTFTITIPVEREGEDGESNGIGGQG